jgi:hypothetical protein
MKDPKIPLAICLLLLMCSACTPNMVRLVEMNGATLSPGNQLVFDNDTVSLTYNMWADNGTVSFVLTNKSSKPIYIDWKKSMMFINNTSYLYWQDQDQIAMSSEGTVTPGYGLGPASRIVATNSQGTVSHPERISFVPPHSNYAFSGPSLKAFNTVPDSSSGKDIQVQKTYKKAGKMTKVNVRRYSADNSPIQIRNYITYTFKENSDEEHVVDHKLWAEVITTMPQHQFMGKGISVYNGNDQPGIKHEYPFRSPHRYYYYLTSAY